MAIVFIDSFDLYTGAITDTTTNVLSRWACNFINDKFIQIPGFDSPQAFGLPSAGTEEDVIIGPTSPFVFPNGVVNFAFGVTIKVAGAAHVISTGHSGIAYLINVYIDANGSIRVVYDRNGATIFASPPGTYQFNQPMFIEITGSVSNNATVNGYIDGAQFGHATGVNLTTFGQTQLNEFSMVEGGGGTYYYDNLYINNTGVPYGRVRAGVKNTSDPNYIPGTDFVSSLGTESLYSDPLVAPGINASQIAEIVLSVEQAAYINAAQVAVISLDVEYVIPQVYVPLPVGQFMQTFPYWIGEN